MNEHLKIPAQIQALINDIENVELYLSELPLPEHPKLPQFNRSIRVLDIDAKSRQEFVNFIYEQVLKDKETGEEINISLPAPEWVVYKETWSFLRDEQNNTIELPLIEPIDKITKDNVKVSSFKYMIWLMKNNKISFLQLIQGYLAGFVETKIEELNKL
ncbi:hypothetical protein [Chryseobacterium sp.]|uniref:hypothetical protein n=1 Tax=Chryseobacterium sp. TaxID=1871047 RepID=UPI0035AE6363